MSRHLCRQGRFFIIVLPIQGAVRETRRDAGAGGETRGEMAGRGRRKRRKEKEREIFKIVPRDEPARLSLPTNGAHILISTRSPSYYWLEINRPFRG